MVAELVIGGEELALADRFPAIAGDVQVAGIEDPAKVDDVIQSILDRTATIYKNDGRLDAVQPFPLPTELSVAAANEVVAYVEANGFESLLSGTLNC